MPIRSEMSLRVTTPLWYPEEQFVEFFRMMRRLDAFEEYAFFTHDCHTPPPLAEMLCRTTILRERITKMREIAPRIGVNHLCTLGHADEDLVWAKSNSGRLFQGSLGGTTAGNFCPRDPEWRETYLRPVYRSLAEAQPDFIWIDDDLRLNNHGKPFDYGCFCDDCFSKLCEFFQFSGTREEFIASFDQGNLEQLRERRVKMLDWNRSVLSDLLSFIERIIHEVNPSIIIGKMDGADFWETDRKHQAPLLRGPENLPVWWRPGGGLYDDRVPDAILTKADALGGIIATLPECVTVIQSEIENFPYPNSAKSDRFTCLETSVYCAAGCTGAALNILGDPAWAPLQTYEKRMLALKAVKPFNDRIVAFNAGLPPSGIWDGFDSDHFLGNAEVAPQWLTRACRPEDSMRGSHSFHALGLPRAYANETASCAVLGATCAQALSHETLMGLFAKGIYLDADALDILNERGYGEYTGFQTKDRFSRDAMETSVPHSLNPVLPFLRNIRQSFWGGTATALEPTRPEAQILTRLVDYHGTELAPCVSGAFENRLGGRIVANGYGAWVLFGYAPKYQQLHRIFRWLSHEQLDAEVTDSVTRTGVWARQRPDGGVNVAILNASFDPAINLSVRIRTNVFTVVLLRDRKADMELKAESREGKFATFLLPEVRDWELVYLATGK